MKDARTDDLIESLSEFVYSLDRQPLHFEVLDVMPGGERACMPNRGGADVDRDNVRRGSSQRMVNGLGGTAPSDQDRRHRLRDAFGPHAMVLNACSVFIRSPCVKMGDRRRIRMTVVEIRHRVVTKIARHGCGHELLMPARSLSSTLSMLKDAGS